MKRITSLLLSLALLLTLFALPAFAEPAEFTTFEDAFKTWTGDWAGKGALKMRLKDNTMTFDYRPAFYFDKSYGFTDEEKQSMVEDCAACYQRWAGTYDIRGHELTIEVNVTPEITDSKLCANVQFLPEFGVITTMVPGCLIWNRNRCSTVYYRAHDMYRLKSYVAAHEFGHVLGLFDAYGYDNHFAKYGAIGEWLGSLLPEATLDRAPSNCMMRGGQYVSATEAEMLLYAWKNNRLQLYMRSVLRFLGAQESPVFG